MADVTLTLALTKEAAESGTVQVGGTVELRPTVRRNVSGEVVVPEPLSVTLTAGESAPTVVLTKDDGSTWAWQVLERVAKGRGSWTTFTVSDQDDDATVALANVTLVDPDTLTPVDDAAETVAEALTARLQAAENLADLDDAATARTNLGLGTAATTDATAYATAAQGAKADAAQVAAQLDADSAALLDSATDTRAAHDARYAGIEGALGRWYNKLATDPTNAKVVFLGDSTFRDAGTGAEMYDMLREWHNQPGMALPGVPEENIIAGGSSGASLEAWLSGSGSYPPSSLIADDPDLIVCGFGLNDVRLGHADKPEMIGRFESLVAWRDTNLPDADLLIITPPTMTTTVVGQDYVDGVTHQEASDILYEAVMAMENRFQHVGVADTAFLLWGRKALATSPLKTDELHPNAIGYRMIAHVLAESFLSRFGEYNFAPRGLGRNRYVGYVVSAGSGYIDIGKPESDARYPEWSTLTGTFSTSDTAYFATYGALALTSATFAASGSNLRILKSGSWATLVGQMVCINK